MASLDAAKIKNDRDTQCKDAQSAYQDLDSKFHHAVEQINVLTRHLEEQTARAKG